MSDSLQRFLFENLQIRGEMIHLDATWRAVLERHDYPEPVREVLGQAMAAAMLLSATLKYDGSLTLQVKGDGPISLMVVQAQADRTLRGIAHWEGDVPSGGDLQSLFGSGHMVVTIDPGVRERYQGIVNLEGDSVAEALDNYLERSEQLDTRMWLVSSGDAVAGMLVQKLPEESEDEDAWNRVVTLGDTVTDEELLELGAPDLIRRLFHEEDIRLFEAEPVSFRCSCSRERVGEMLRNLGREEVASILADEGEIAVNCDFCNQRYTFDAVDAEQLFAEHPQPAIIPTRH